MSCSSVSQKMLFKQAIQEADYPKAKKILERMPKDSLSYQKRSYEWQMHAGDVSAVNALVDASHGRLLAALAPEKRERIRNATSVGFFRVGNHHLKEGKILEALDCYDKCTPENRMNGYTACFIRAVSNGDPVLAQRVLDRGLLPFEDAAKEPVYVDILNKNEVQAAFERGIEHPKDGSKTAVAILARMSRNEALVLKAVSFFESYAERAVAEDLRKYASEGCV